MAKVKEYPSPFRKGTFTEFIIQIIFLWKSINVILIFQ